MNRPLLHATALAGVMVALGMTPACAGGAHWQRVPPVPGIVRLSPADLAPHPVRRAYRAATPLTARHREDYVARSRFPAGWGYDSYWSGYGSSGFGYGSTGYGYGGDFSLAYTSDYDMGQTVGYATETGIYGGRRLDAGDYYGYGYRRGWAPPIPPAGGLAVYSPGAYGPGPRIVVIPTHYKPGRDSFGCHCSSRGY
jgi:hypothetical protein